MSELVANSIKHICYGQLKVPLRLPAPLLTGTTVVEIVRPTARDLLLHRVNVLVHGKLRDVLLNLGSDNLRCEAHRCHVEAVAVNEL